VGWGKGVIMKKNDYVRVTVKIPRFKRDDLIRLAKIWRELYKLSRGK